MFDTGAAVNVTLCCSDFISFTMDHSTMNDIAAQAIVRGCGKVCWKVNEDSGHCHFIITTSYYVPDTLL